MNEQDQRVRDYYNNLSLPQDKLDRLLDIKPNVASDARSDVSESQNTQSASSAKRVSRFNPFHWQKHYWLPTGLAAAFVLIASLWMHNSNTDADHMRRTVREVAMNHTTRLEPEYRGQTLAMLDNSMQQLPFTLTLPKTIDKNYELVGSRYCSLGGELAAHVRLKSRGSGKPMSLFVTGNSAELKNIRSQQTTLEGVDVEFWREGGLFFALAQRS